MEKHISGKTIDLSREQTRLLERFSPEFREHHIETRHTGDLVAAGTFFVGTRKGIGKVYLQTVIDCFSRLVRALSPLTQKMNNGSFHK